MTHWLARRWDNAVGPAALSSRSDAARAIVVKGER